MAETPKFWSDFYASIYGEDPESGVGSPPSTRSVQSVPDPQIVWNTITPTQEQSLIYRNGGPTRPATTSALPTRTVEQMYLGIYPTQPGQFRIGSSVDLGPSNPNGAAIARNLTGSVNAQGQQVASQNSWSLPGLSALGGGNTSPNALGFNAVNRPASASGSTNPASTARSAASVPAWISSLPAAQAYQPAPTPAPAPAPSLYYTNPMEFGRQSVSQSGDTSVGNQLDAAAARSSGEGGRTRRY